MALEQLDIHVQKTKFRTDLTLFTKINSKWIIDLSVKFKTTKLLEDRIRGNLGDLGFGNDFFFFWPLREACGILVP